MKRLVDCVVLMENNDNCVVLKVKEDCVMDLICLGCFSGNETMIRMTKDDDDNSYCIWYNNGNTCSWSNRTIKSTQLGKKQKMIAKCIHSDMGINMGKSIAFWDRIGTLDK